MAYRAPGRIDQRALSYLAMTDSCRLVAAATSPRPPGRLITDGEVGLYGEQGFADFGRMAKGIDERPRQTIFATSARHYVVWLETTSTDMFRADWRVYSRNTHSGVTRLLGDSTEISGGRRLPDVPGGSEPTIGRDLVAWATARPSGGTPAFEAAIMGRRLDGSGRRTTLVRHAKLPALSGPDLYYVRSLDVSPDVTDGQYEIHRRVSGGRDAVILRGALRPGEEVNALRVSGERMAWVVGSLEAGRATLYLRDGSGAVSAIELGHGGASTMALSLTGDLLVWGNGSATGADAGQYVFDLRTERLSKLGEQEGYSVAMASGSCVAWAEVPDSPTGRAWFRVARWTG